MKKLLALLLALMLPVCVLAESRGISLKFSTDESFQPVMEEGLRISGVPEAEITSMVQAIQRLIDGLEVDLTAQQDALSVNLFVGGGTLFDFIFRHTKDETVVTSSLLPEYALTEKREEPAPSVSYETALNSAKDAFTAWLTNMTPTVEEGSYYGDTFRGGARCTTWMLTDQDVAALINTLMTAEVRGYLTARLQQSGLSGVKLLQQFDAATSRMAQADTYAYILQLVDDTNGQFIGANLTIITEMDPVATVSFGKQKERYSIVLGMGMNGFNYWQECELNVIHRKNVYILDGSMREWISEKAISFQDVKKTEVVGAYSTHCLLNRSLQRWFWEGDVYVGADFNQMQTLLGYDGSYDQEDRSVQAAVYLGVEPETPIRADLIIGPGKPIPPAEDTLNHVAADDAIAFNQLVTSFFNSLYARLFELLPPELLMMLMQQ